MLPSKRSGVKNFNGNIMILRKQKIGIEFSTFAPFKVKSSRTSHQDRRNLSLPSRCSHHVKIEYQRIITWQQAARAWTFRAYPIIISYSYTSPGEKRRENQLLFEQGKIDVEIESRSRENLSRRVINYSVCECWANRLHESECFLASTGFIHVFSCGNMQIHKYNYEYILYMRI